MSLTTYTQAAQNALYNTPAKKEKDLGVPEPTALEKYLKHITEPIRVDGSDKFFGFENVRASFPLMEGMANVLCA